MRRSYKNGNARCISVEEQNVSHRNLQRTVWNTDASLIKPAKFEQRNEAKQPRANAVLKKLNSVFVFSPQPCFERAEIFPLARSGFFVARYSRYLPELSGLITRHCNSFTSHLAGRVNRNSEPRPSVLSTLTLPPWASTNVFTIARPRPNPAV